MSKEGLPHSTRVLKAGESMRVSTLTWIQLEPLPQPLLPLFRGRDFSIGNG